MKVLNLYAGIGGNRKKWEDCEVTSVELNQKIAEVYSKLYPKDDLIVSDAHEYLLNNFENFDFIWSSPPCQSHSRMVKATRHNVRKYPDLSLYQEIILLKEFFKGKFVVENVVPYYEPLIEGQKVGRHLYWANFNVGNYVEPSPKGFITIGNLAGKKKLMDWLDIHFEENLYLGGNHDPCQILRNCVHPNEGLSVFNNAKAKQ